MRAKKFRGFRSGLLHCEKGVSGVYAVFSDGKAVNIGRIKESKLSKRTFYGEIIVHDQIYILTNYSRTRLTREMVLLYALVNGISWDQIEKTSKFEDINAYDFNVYD